MLALGGLELLDLSLERDAPVLCLPELLGFVVELGGDLVDFLVDLAQGLLEEGVLLHELLDLARLAFQLLLVLLDFLLAGLQRCLLGLQSFLDLRVDPLEFLLGVGLEGLVVFLLQLQRLKVGQLIAELLVLPTHLFLLLLQLALLRLEKGDLFLHRVQLILQH
jgi:hypothetical protein